MWECPYKSRRNISILFLLKITQTQVGKKQKTWNFYNCYELKHRPK
uniref:Uncharacterized protein n=1 Tax=Rhizophora mucronata TaxID=61149 RepID=A0A2P2N5S8_RHIMU